MTAGPHPRVRTRPLPRLIAGVLSQYGARQRNETLKLAKSGSRTGCTGTTMKSTKTRRRLTTANVTGQSGLTAVSRRSSDESSPDKLCARFGRTKSRITVRVLRPADENDETLIVFEGGPRALAFLGRLFLAQASFSDTGFQISPRGPGRRLFTKESEVGLYIQRVPERER
jgi:hypothetical protein